MASFTKTIFIGAPVEKVFAFMEEPTSMLGVWPSMVDIRNVTDLGGGMRKYEWTYKMAGMKLNGTSEVTEYQPNERLVEVTRGGIDSKFTWTFVPLNGGTQLTSSVEYTVPVPVLGRLAEGLITKQNEREADTLLNNIKMVMEKPEQVERT